MIVAPLVALGFWLGRNLAALQLRTVAFQSLIAFPPLVHPLPSHLWKNHSASALGSVSEAKKARTSGSEPLSFRAFGSLGGTTKSSPPDSLPSSFIPLSFP